MAVNAGVMISADPIDSIDGCLPVTTSLIAELRAFDATIQAGSMSGAARLLGLRQSTISAHIGSLETRYGVELFLRRSRRLEVTEFGLALVETSRRIFAAEGDARALLMRARNRYTGRLRLSAVGPYNLVPLLGRFRARWPHVTVSVAVGDSRDVVERVLDHRADLGVLVHAVDDPRIHAVALGRQQLVVFAPRDHALTKRACVRLADLEGQEFVMREEGSTTREVFEAGLRQAGVKVRIGLEMGSRESVREAVAQGLGLGVVASNAYVPDERLVALPIEGAALHTHPHAICLRERQAVPLVASFLDVVAEALAAKAAAARMLQGKSTSHPHAP